MGPVRQKTARDAVNQPGEGHGADHGKLAPMSRVDGAGNELEWTLAVSEELPFDGLAPFLIDWGTSTHPAASGIPAGAGPRAGDSTADRAPGLRVDPTARTAEETRVASCVSG